MDLNNKNVVLCVTGGIAAYKSVSLASLLKKKGANVYAVLTKSAQEFVTPLTFKTITRNKVTTELFDQSDFIPHISLSELADLVIIAPATANIIAKAANGIADDMVSTLLLSCTAPKLVVPAMNTEMYLNPVTQKNMNTLLELKYHFMTPDSGEMACGTTGIGRFPSIESIYETIKQLKSDKIELSYFQNKKVLITVGGTKEDIDPVRFITNRSSGKMGFSIAGLLTSSQADVHIICGNVDQKLLYDFQKQYPLCSIQFIHSADEMNQAVQKAKDLFDIYIMAAAVADYRPEFHKQKIKKENNDLTIKLSKTTDILKELPKRKNAVYIGFAAETNDLLENAKKKLTGKGLTFLIANSVNGQKSAIGTNNAEVYLLNQWNDDIKHFQYETKEVVTKEVFSNINEILLSNQNFH